jgi:hypothetical protein
MESKGGIRSDVLWLPSLYSFHLIDPSVPKLDSFHSSSAPAGCSAAPLAICAIDIPAIGVAGFDFFEFGGAATKRTPQQLGLNFFHVHIRPVQLKIKIAASTPMKNPRTKMAASMAFQLGSAASLAISFLEAARSLRA